MQTNSYLDNCKVIGNIFESPELIENKIKYCKIYDTCVSEKYNKIDCLGKNSCYH